jgi:formiminotetrahydrofolate cyclodeaminase
MRNQPIGGWLDELASAAPAPGGGAAAALDAAMAAALIEMVCNLTIGKPAYVAHEPMMVAVRDRAHGIREDAVGLAEQDAAAFDAVIEAYRLPRASEADAAARAARIQQALAGASAVPQRTAAAASELLTLAQQIVAEANPNVVSDVAASAAAARSALAAALVNIEINRGSISDPALRAELASSIGEIEADLLRADSVLAAVRARLAA